MCVEWNVIVSSRAIDYHIYRLSKCGLVQEDRAFGNVKLYGLTTSGETLLRLLREFECDGKVVPRATGLDASSPSSSTSSSWSSSS